MLGGSVRQCVTENILRPAARRTGLQLLDYDWGPVMSLSGDGSREMLIELMSRSVMTGWT